MPVLYILGGANGAGKTTFYNTLIETGFLNNQLPFLNVDLIVKEEFRAFTDQNFLLAEEIYRKRISDLFNEKKDFMIESNVARESDYSWIESVKRTGYKIVLFFLGTSSVDININRVKKRVVEGGHDIPVPIIEHRYQMSLVYLKTKLYLFDEVYFIDNSTDLPMEVAVLKSGKLIPGKSDLIKWVNDILSIAEKLAKRNNLE